MLPDAPSTGELTVLLREIQLDHTFHDEVNERFVNMRGRRMSFERWTELLYVIVRVMRPRVVVLTGVFDGAADAMMLRAMQRNAYGTLVSIDLPAVEAISLSTSEMKDSSLPRGQKPGWLVPDDLRLRYDLRLGDSRELLPAALKEFLQIDIFVHDSLHTYDHQLFEYSMAWPSIRVGGLLMSDDVLWNMAFWHFIRKVKRESARVDTLGAVRK